MSEKLSSFSKGQGQERLQKITGLLFELFLVFLIFTGVSYRFNWVNWNQDTNLHPDEYGLTNTLTQLSIPKSIDEYFNTRISSISPYAKYDYTGSLVENGPDNRMRWGQLPIILIRQAAEWSGNTGYGEMRLMGRQISALADSLTLLLIFLIGFILYGRRVGLLGTALSALAVMQIQQSHFMTVDNFGSFFTTLTLFACVMVSRTPPMQRYGSDGETRAYRLNLRAAAWYLLFGAAFGMALACKINLLPVGGLVLIAAFTGAADLKLSNLADLRRITFVTICLMLLGMAAAGLSFRISQPMTFRNSSGDTSFFSLQPNPDWVESMKVASAESSGQGGGPPGDQWAHRPIIIFPLANMVMWGMGLPLGLAAWGAFAWALSQVLREGKNWRVHLLPLAWSGGYFIFMATRWVKSIRYFLPIYPFLCLLAAWGLMELWRIALEKQEKSADTPRGRLANLSLAVLVSSIIWITILGTFAWAKSFVTAVYKTPHTRLQATHWIYQNIPGPFQLGLTQADGAVFREPLSAPDGLEFSAQYPAHILFTLKTGGSLTQVVIPHIRSNQPDTLHLSISSDPEGLNILSEAVMPVTAQNHEMTVDLPAVQIEPLVTYYLTAKSSGLESIIISRAMVTSESWDESLPVPFENRDPFGQLYNGKIMEIRWQDDAVKRDEILNTLSVSDYLIVPSQRAVWASCRIPMTFPMTMDYYRALFNGRLGFDEIAQFSAPFQVGPLWVSDLAGTVSWMSKPKLPLFNHSWLAAEEAFSVYDHPPVWIFKKRADFSLDIARKILSQADLSQVVVQSAFNATGDWCPAQ